MDKRNIEQFETTWRDIKLKVSFERDWLNGARIESHKTAHIQIESEKGEALPISANGYRSHFLFAEEIDSAGGPVTFALDWLDRAAMDKACKQRRRFTQPNLI